MDPTDNYLLMKSNKNNSNNDYFIEKWCEIHLRLKVLNDTPSLKRPPILFSTLRIPIKYQILNGKDPTNLDAFVNFFVCTRQEKVIKCVPFVLKTLNLFYVKM